MKNSDWMGALAVGIIVAALRSSVLAQEDSVQNIVIEESAKTFKEEKKSYSPPVGCKFPTRPLWSNTHLHTASNGEGKNSPYAQALFNHLLSPQHAAAMPPNPRCTILGD